jgi:hypothetical protein
MSQLTAPPEISELTHLAKLSVSIRGKLQFMDYLVRAAVADVERFHEEGDAGTRIFIRQLIEMHASSLAVESESMRMIGELCSALEAATHDSGLDPDQGQGHGHGPAHDYHHESGAHASHRNGDAE